MDDINLAASKVIYDFGANNGDDIPYYLQKADVVVAVEANPLLCDEITRRFAAEIEQGRLFLENCVLTTGGHNSEVFFYLHKTNHVLSQFPEPEHPTDFDKVLLPSRSVLDIVKQHGEPHYIKIDIEHYDEKILRALFENGICPPFISAESHSIEVFALLLALGRYRSFKLVDGRTVADKYKRHVIQVNGESTEYTFPAHSAGPFGEDVLGPWMTANDFFTRLAQEGLGWKDIHATNQILATQNLPAPVGSGANDLVLERVAISQGEATPSLEDLITQVSGNHFFVQHPEIRLEPTREQTIIRTTHTRLDRWATRQYLGPFLHALMPKGIESKEHQGYSASPLVFASLADITLMRRSGITFNPQGQVIEETLEAQRWADPSMQRAPDLHIDGGRASLSEVGKSSVEDYSEPTLYANHGPYNVYGHFLFETMCAAYLLRTPLQQGSLKLCLPLAHTEWQPQLLAAMGIPATALVQSEAANIRFKRLILSSSCNGAQTFRPSPVMLELAAHLRAVCGGVAQGKALLYLRRRNSHTSRQRELINSQTLQTQLEQYGFQAVDPSELSFPDQVRLFSSAKMVVGIHGSAFANAIFMPPNGILLDLIPTEMQRDFGFWTRNLSTLTQLKYASLSCRSRHARGRMLAYADVPATLREVTKLLSEP